MISRTEVKEWGQERLTNEVNESVQGETSRMRLWHEVK